jgi:hypothetical protein
MAIELAFLSQSAWSCRKKGKSSITWAAHSGGVSYARSNDNFIRAVNPLKSKHYERNICGYLGGYHWQWKKEMIL